MSDDSGEKKYAASKKKLQDQRKKGQVAQSQDIGKLLALATISEMALVQAQSSMQRLEQLLMLPIARIGQPFARSLQEVIVEAGYVFFGFALLMTATAIVMKLISSWLQFGFLFSPEVLTPDFNRLNPVNQAKQMFSAQSLMTLFTGLIKALLICVVLYLVIGFYPALAASLGSGGSITEQAWAMLGQSVILLVAVFMSGNFTKAITNAVG